MKDLDSSNGTFVNGVRIAEQELNPGDQVGFGQLEATYDAGEEAVPVTGAAEVHVPVVLPRPSTPPSAARPSASPMPRPMATVGGKPVVVPPGARIAAMVPAVSAPLPVSASVPVSVAPVAEVAPAVVVTAMAPPPATVAYDTARKEASAELEILQKKIEGDTAAAAKAAAARAAAELELKEQLNLVEKAKSEGAEIAAGREKAEVALAESLEKERSILTSVTAGVAAAEEELKGMEAAILQARTGMDVERAAMETARAEWAGKLELLETEAAAHRENVAVARQAQEEAELSAHRAEADRDVFLAELSKLKEERSEVATAKSAEEFGLVSLTETRKQCEADLDRLRKEKIKAEAAAAAAAANLAAEGAERAAAKRRGEEELAGMAALLAKLTEECRKAESLRKVAEEETEKLNLLSAAWPVKEAAAKAEFSGLESRILKAREAAAAEDRKMSARLKAIQQLEGQHNVLASKITRWQEQEAAAEKLTVSLTRDRAEAEALRKELAEGTVLRDTARSELAEARSELGQARSELAEATSKRTFLTQEIRTVEARLAVLRAESGDAESLHLKVTALRKAQTESERRLEFLTDRLEGMSEAPDPNWGTVHALARSFIRKLDLMDDLVVHLRSQSGNAEALKQVEVLRSGLLDILKEYSIEAYSLEPGTVIDVAARKRIQIVETRSEESQDATRIVRTFRPGYVCLNGDLGIPTLLRKADVAVAVPLGVAV